MSSIVTKDFADRLQDLISDSGKSIKELSNEIGISAGALSKYQNDGAEAGIDALTKIAKHFNVSADWLLGLSETKSDNPSIRSVCDFTGLPKEFIEEYLYVRDKKHYGNDLINKFLLHPAFWDAMFLLYAADALPKIKSGSPEVFPEFRQFQEVVMKETDGLYTVANTGYLLSGMLFEIQELLTTACAQSTKHGKQKIFMRGYGAEIENLVNKD